MKLLHINNIPGGKKYLICPANYTISVEASKTSWTTNSMHYWERVDENPLSNNRKCIQRHFSENIRRWQQRFLVDVYGIALYWNGSNGDIPNWLLNLTKLSLRLLFCDKDDFQFNSWEDINIYIISNHAFELHYIYSQESTVDGQTQHKMLRPAFIISTLFHRRCSSKITDIWYSHPHTHTPI